MTTFKKIPVHSIGGSGIAIRQYQVAGACGASSGYEMLVDGFSSFRVDFQSQDPALGINGWTNEALLAVLKDRFEGFQSGPLPDKFNARALRGISLAITAMKERAKHRKRKGIRGKFTSGTRKKAKKATKRKLVRA